MKKYLLLLTYYSGLIRVLARLARERNRNTHCLITYHRIVDGNTVFLPKGDIVHHRLSDFSREMAFLKRYFRIVSLDEMLMNIGGSTAKGPYACILFDDGYLDNYTLAFPVLKKLEIPACIYLTAGLIGTNELLWPDQIETMLLRTGKREISLPGSDQIIGLQGFQERVQANNRISSYLKSVGNDEKNEIIEELKSMTGVAPDRESRMMLGWEEVREMHRCGIVFGAHTMTHPILTRMPLEEAKREIRESKETIEKNLGARVRHFAIPNGEDKDFSDELRDYCLKIGLETVATANWGFVKGKNDLGAMRRLGAVPPLYNFASQLMINLART